MWALGGRGGEGERGRGSSRQQYFFLTLAIFCCLYRWNDKFNIKHLKRIKRSVGIEANEVFFVFFLKTCTNTLLLFPRAQTYILVTSIYQISLIRKRACCFFFFWWIVFVYFLMFFRVSDTFRCFTSKKVWIWYHLVISREAASVLALTPRTLLITFFVFDSSLPA